MPSKFGPYFPFRRDNRKPDGTWEAPDATRDNIKGTSVDHYDPVWPRWRQTPPADAEGEFVSDDPFFDIDEIAQKAEFYPPGRPLVDKNVDGHPASRQRVSDTDAGNLWRRRLLLGTASEEMPPDELHPPTGPIQLAAAQRPAPSGAARQRRVFSPEMQANNRLIAESYLREPKVQAFLDTIAWAEGGDYDIRFGGRRFSDYSRFPAGGGAAGRYQFVPTTYNEVMPALGLTDFTPRTQDLLAVQYMIDRGIINQVVAGNLDGALPTGSHMWASLPQSPSLGGYYVGRSTVTKRPSPIRTYGRDLTWNWREIVRRIHRDRSRSKQRDAEFAPQRLCSLALGEQEFEVANDDVAANGSGIRTRRWRRRCPGLPRAKLPNNHSHTRSTSLWRLALRACSRNGARPSENFWLRVGSDSAPVLVHEPSYAGARGAGY